MYGVTMSLQNTSVLLCTAMFMACPLFSALTVEDAREFLNLAEAKLLELNVNASRADWVKSTYITDDTEILAAEADAKLINAAGELVKESRRFDKVTLPPDLARKMHLLKVGLTVAAPSDPKESEELTKIIASMEGTYGKGKYCPATTSGHEERRGKVPGS